MIDNSDHWSHGDPDISAVNFLRYPDWAWPLISLPPGDYQNRLRHVDYVRMLRHAGFAILLDPSVPDPVAVAAVRAMRVARRFRKFAPGQLGVITSYLVAAPVERGGSVKILYHHRTGSRDGQAVHIDELVGALRRIGADVVVVAPPMVEGQAFGGESRLASRLRRLLPRALYELAEVAYNVPVFLRLRRAYLRHRPDALYERHNLHLLAGSWLRRRYGVPFLLEVNAPLAAERGAHGGLALPALAHATETAVWKAADVVLPVTGVLRDMLRVDGVPDERIVVVPNGIDMERFAAAPHAGRRAGAARARPDASCSASPGSCGPGTASIRRSTSCRGPKARTACCWWWATGPARAALEAQARHLGVAERVRFTGVVARDDVPAHVAAFDVALQPASTPVCVAAEAVRVHGARAAGRRARAAQSDGSAARRRRCAALRSARARRAAKRARAAGGRSGCCVRGSVRMPGGRCSRGATRGSTMRSAWPRWSNGCARGAGALVGGGAVAVTRPRRGRDRDAAPAR